MKQVSADRGKPDHDKPGCCGRKRRGRPVQIDPATRQCMVIDAVSDLLCQCRLEDLSMAAIARKAGMSKRTLYALFSSREELLGATFARIGRLIFRPLSHEERRLPLRDRLDRLLTVDSLPKFEQAPLELMRAVVADAPVNPGIARQFDAEGRGALIRYIAEELEGAALAGEVELKGMTASELAELLVDMIMGDSLHRLLLPELPFPTPEEKRQRREKALQVFLEGVCPR